VAFLAAIDGECGRYGRQARSTPAIAMVFAPSLCWGLDALCRMQQGRRFCLHRAQWSRPGLEDNWFGIGKVVAGRWFPVSSSMESDEDGGTTGQWAWGKSPADQPQGFGPRSVLLPRLTTHLHLLWRSFGPGQVGVSPISGEASATVAYAGD
jgi:hypothetical protein